MTVFVSQRYATFADATRLDLYAIFGDHLIFRGAAQLCRLIDTVKPGCVFVDGEQDEALVRLAQQWGGQVMPRWTPPEPPEPPDGGDPNPEELKEFGDSIAKALLDSGDFQEIKEPETKPAKPKRKAA